MNNSFNRKEGKQGWLERFRNIPGGTRRLALNLLGILLAGIRIFDFNPVGLGYFAALGMNGSGMFSVAAMVAGMYFSFRITEILKNASILVAVLLIYRILSIGKLKLSEQAGAFFLGFMCFMMEGIDYTMTHSIGNRPSGSGKGMEELLLVMGVSVMTGLLCVIFERGTRGFRNGRRALSQEEMMGAAVIAGFLVYRMGTIPAISKSQILMAVCFLVLYAAYKYGMGMGALMGMTCGIPVCILEGEMNYLGMICMMGILAGLFRDLGRLFSGAAMLMLGLLTGTVYLQEVISPSQSHILIKGMLGALVVFELLPKNMIYRYEENINEHRDEDLRMMFEERLMNMARSFEQLSKSMFSGQDNRQVLALEGGAGMAGDWLSDRDREAETDIERNQKAAATTNLWEGRSEERAKKIGKEKREKMTGEEMTGMTGGKNDQRTENVIITTQTNDCEKTEMKRTKEGERRKTQDETSMERAIWRNRLNESRILMSEQMEQISKIIEDYSKQVYNFVRITDEQEEYIRHSMKLKGVYLDKIVGLQNHKNRREYLVTAKCDRRITVGSREIAEIISEALGRRYVPSGNCRKLIGSEFSMTTYVEETNFIARHAAAGRARGEGGISGDNYSLRELENGHLLMGLSDGMGYGSSACIESETVIELLEQLLSSGFSAECALKMINSVMVMNYHEDHPATLDYGVIDLHSGICDLVKLGAAATFVKRGSWVETIKSTSMPLGIFPDVDYDCTSKKLYDGDMVIMVSDGVVDAIENAHKHEELVKIISDVQGLSPKQLAEAILQCAVGDRKRVPDDMTVLVTEISENKAMAA